MTNTSSRHSSRDLNRSSGSRSPRSEYSNSRSNSRYQSRSPHSCSRTSSRSRSGSDRSKSWTRSRSNSRWHRKSYASRSRSRTRSRSSFSDNNLDSSRGGGRRCSYSRSDRSFTRSRSSSHLQSRSSSSSRTSPSDAKTRNKDPRDRSRRVHWPNGVWIVGEKAKDTTFHFCDICDLPIVIYGRLLPCKHVFCYTCALNLSGKCNRCQKSVQNVERCLVGGIFMCFRSDCCRRTYLSQRDLQAHIDHRHRTVATGGSSSASTAVVALASSGSVASTRPVKPVPSIRSTVETGLHQPTVTSQSYQVNPSPGIIGMPPRSLPVPATSPSPDEFVGKASGLLPLPPKPSQLMPQPMVSTRHRVGLPRTPNSSLLPVGTGFQSYHSNKGALPPVLLPPVRGPPLSTFVDVPPPVPVVSSVSTSSVSSSSTASVSATMTALAMAAAASLSSHSTRVDNQQNRTAPQVGLNLSFLSTALRAVDTGWALGNVTAAAGNVRPAIPGPRGLTGQMLPGQLKPGTLGGANQQPMNRFPF